MLSTLIQQRWLSASLCAKSIDYLHRNHIITVFCLKKSHSGIILGMGSNNERRRYYITSPLIGWAHTQNDPCHYAVYPQNYAYGLCFDMFCCGYITTDFNHILQGYFAIEATIWWNRHKMAIIWLNRHKRHNIIQDSLQAFEEIVAFLVLKVFWEPVEKKLKLHQNINCMVRKITFCTCHKNISLNYMQLYAVLPPMLGYDIEPTKALMHNNCFRIGLGLLDIRISARGMDSLHIYSNFFITSFFSKTQKALLAHERGLCGVLFKFIVWYRSCTCHCHGMGYHVIIDHVINRFYCICKSNQHCLSC